MSNQGPSIGSFRRTAISLAALALLAGTSGATQDVAQPPPRPALRKSFSANMTGYSFAPGTGNMTSNNQPIAISEDLQSILNVEINPDGRPVRVVFDYHNDSRAGIFSLQPFFDEQVCFIFPPQPIPPQYNAFEIGVEFLWFNQAWEPTVMASYNQSKFNGTDSIAGQACDRWVWAPGGLCGADGMPIPPATDCDQISWCVVRDSGGLISVNRSVVTHQGNKTYNQQLRNVFSGFVPTADESSFTVPHSGCADMRPIGGGSQPSEQQQLNDPARLKAINKAAAGGWTAAPNMAWEGLTGDDVAASRLGLRTPLAHSKALRRPPGWAGPAGFTPLAALRLGLPGAAHRAGRDAVAAAAGGIPTSFDVRQAFPSCNSARAVRNQGACGGCWAFAGAEALADRLCVGAAGARFQNLSLSPEYFMDCDALNAACGGGLIDDAWKFLATRGLAAEQCDPYLYCAHPVSPSCETGVHPKRQPPHKVACPTSCNGTGKPLSLHRAKNAYAVAAPADVPSMQKEIMAHGSIEVGFQVFEDFMTYHNGTYQRTAGSPGPKGGHAVKVLGWGVDHLGVDYWLAANSWSPLWGGLGGFFHIRRGTNECGIETTPAAGLPDLTAVHLA